MIFKKQPEEKPKQIHGGRNLIIMCFLATTVALTTTAISLTIYRATGDIYLDRSRPGYIAEDEKHNVEDDSKEMFSSEGAVTAKDIDEYLETLELVDSRIRNAIDDFSEAPLSDETLGINEVEDLEESEDILE